MSRVRYKGCKRSVLGTEVPPCWIMEGTEAWELYHVKRTTMKIPNQPKDLDYHMAEGDIKWRKMEGRRPYAELTERERMLEGSIPWTQAAWDRLLAKEAAAQVTE